MPKQAGRFVLTTAFITPRVTDAVV